MRRGAAQRRHRRPYRRITWQEMEQAFEVLFSHSLESRAVARIIRRFKESRRQVIPFFLQMIQAADPRERETASYVLERLGQGAVRSLKKVATDPDLSEVARLEIAALLEKLEGRRAGVPTEPGVEEPDEPTEVAETADLLDELEKDPGRFLNGLEDETVLAEVLDGLARLEADDQVRFVEKLAAPQDERALRLLLPLLSVEEDDLLTAVLQALMRIPSDKALPGLHGLVEGTTRKRLRILANRAIREIERGIVQGRTSRRRRGRRKRRAQMADSPLPFYRAYATEVGGEGEQMLLVSRERPDDQLQVLIAVHSDLYGLLEIRGWENMPREEFRAIVREWRLGGHVPVEVPLTYCREMLQETEKHTQRRERPLPDDYQTWAPMLESAAGSNPKAPSHLDFAEQVDPAALERSGALVERPEFSSWRFPTEEIGSYLETWNDIQDKREGERLEREEALISRFLNQRMTRRIAALLRVRLLRQAWLLRRAGQEAEADAGIAAATALLREHGIRYQQHVLLRALARKTLADLTGPIEGEAEAS